MCTLAYLGIDIIFIACLERCAHAQLPSQSCLVRAEGAVHGRVCGDTADTRSQRTELVNTVNQGRCRDDGHLPKTDSPLSSLADCTELELELRLVGATPILCFRDRHHYDTFRTGWLILLRYSQNPLQIASR